MIELGPVQSLLLLACSLVAQFNTPASDHVRADFGLTLLIGLALAATAVIVSELIRPKPKLENQKPANRGDFSFPTAVEGRPVPLIWGTVKIEGPNVVWWGNLQQQAIREKVSTGLFSSKRITRGFRYFVGIQFALCRGPATLQKIWIGDKEITVDSGSYAHETGAEFADTEFFGGDRFGSGGISGTVRFHDGRSDQDVSAYLDPLQAGVGITPAYRGTSYLVAEDIYIGNSTSIKPWAFEMRRIPQNIPGLASMFQTINSADANPIEVLYEILTNGEWGFNFPTADIDTASFVAAAETLAGENNGFSFQLERTLELGELIDIVAEQIDGALLLNRTTGQFEVVLARDDYVLTESIVNVSSGVITVAEGGDLFASGDTIYIFDTGGVNDGEFTVSGATTATTIPVAGLTDQGAVGTISGVREIVDDNIVEIKDYGRQMWDGTTNQFRASFTDRARDYFDTFAQSHDLANQRMQEGEIVAAEKSYPGVKDRDLANAITARELRFLSLPIAKASMILDRTFWDTQPGQVFRWTNSELGITNLPVRVIRADFGDYIDGRILCSFVQDIFSLEDAFFGAPIDTGWELPSQDIGAVPVAQQLVFEAPKKFLDLDPLDPTIRDRLWWGGRSQGPGIGIDPYWRESAGDPSGDYQKDGEIDSLFAISSLNVALSVTDANPTPTIQLSGSPDTISALALRLDPNGASATEIGQQLANLILIDDEFIAFESIANQTTTTIDLVNCYRGLLDSVPADHSVSALVYHLWSGGGLNDTSLTQGFNVDAQPRHVSRDDVQTEGEANTFEIVMSNRELRPYAPHELSVEGTRFGTSLNVDGGATIAFERRDYLNTDEVVILGGDAATFEAGFQAKNNHLNRVQASVTDSDSLVIAAAAGSFASGTSDTISRGDLLAKTDGALPSSVTISVDSRHTVDSVDYDSRAQLTHEVTTVTTTDLTGLDNLGTVFANGPVSRTYTCAAAVTHDLTLDATVTSVEYRLNGGSWTVIASLSGETIAINDTLEFRHTDSGDTGAVVGVLDENGTDVAYVVFDTVADFDGLVGYWTMNESSDGTGVVDRAARFGGAPDFADQNNCESGTGQFGNAARVMDLGSDVVEHLYIADSDASEKALYPGTTESWTITCWVRIPSGGASSGNNQQIIWSMADFDVANPFTGGGGRLGYLFYDIYGVGATDGFTFVRMQTTVGGAGQNFDSVRGISLGGASGVNDEETWLLVGCVFDASGPEIRLFVTDGAGSDDTGTTSCGATGLATTEGISIGTGYHSGSPESTLAAQDLLIDDFRIWRGQAFSDVELEALATATQPLV